MPSEIRRHPIFDALVLLVPDRGNRPNAFIGTDEISRCPFCPGNESDTPAEVFRTGGPHQWNVRVFPNLYPAVGAGGVEGAHEVVVETPQHDLRLSAAGDDQIDQVLLAYQERLRAHFDDGVEQVFIFKNEGAGAGRSIEHPHSQIIAFREMPATLRQREASLAERASEAKDCLVCTAIRTSPIIDERCDFVTFVPAEARFPYELCIAPARHEADITEMTAERRRNFARVLRRALIALDETFDHPDFNWILECAPRRDGTSVAWHHWTMTIIPRLTAYAGFELATGITINVVRPEAAAERYGRSIARQKKELVER